MTPRTKELSGQADLSWFSEELLSQSQNKETSFNLTDVGPIFKFLHPALIKCRYYFEYAPQELSLKQKVKDWEVRCYFSRDQAEGAHPTTRSFEGYPHHIYQFLQADPDEALLHFKSLGSIFVSKTPLTLAVKEPLELVDYQLPLWLDYALSAELWGPSGKWTRFHQRLHTQFEKYGLLIEEDSPGYYPLKNEAHWLNQFGFKGKLSSSSYNLIFPWDFPLSGLIELEKVLARGP